MMQYLKPGLMLFSLALMAGCGREESITSYRVPKADVVYELNHVAGSARPKAAADRPERTLAAIVTQAAQGWFFKLSGPPEEVASQQQAFDEFIRSLKFAGEQPKWTLPADWKEKPGSGMRFATLEISTAGDKPLELSVISLPRGEDPEAAYLLANINRWRGQLQLPPIAAADLADEAEKIEVAGATAYVVDLEGTASGAGMGGPFAGGMRELPAARPSAVEPAAANSATAALKFDTPEGWKAGPATGFRKAAFTVSDGDAKAEITVIDLAGAAGDVLANVNRWRGQVGLKEQSQAELDKELKTIAVDGQDARYVMLEGPGVAGKPQTILGVIVSHPEKSWFIKLLGDAALAAREKERFESFVKSVKFGVGEDANHGQ